MLVLMCTVAGISFTVTPAAALDLKKFVTKTPKFDISQKMPVVSDPNQPVSYLTVNVPIDISDIPHGWRSAKLFTQAMVFFALETSPGQMDVMGVGNSELKETPLTNSAHFTKSVPLQITQLKQGVATNKTYGITLASLKLNDTCIFLGMGSAGNFDPQLIGGTPLTGFDQYKGMKFDCSNNVPFPF
jgi:hypothetical protein